MSIGLGDTVRWIPTGEIGTVLGLTTEPSAIVDFGSRAVTIGVSLLEPADPPPAPPRPAAGGLAAQLADRTVWTADDWQRLIDLAQQTDRPVILIPGGDA